jgi:hypothetical protein
MPIIIRGERGLSSVFAILLRSPGRLRASHINPSHSAADACTTRAGTPVAVQDVSPTHIWR